jgi:hypothetical protein
MEALGLRLDVGSANVAHERKTTRIATPPDIDAIVNAARKPGLGAKRVRAPRECREDCPGAVRFVGPERMTALVREGDGHIDWLTEAEIAERLRALPSGGRTACTRSARTSGRRSRKSSRSTRTSYADVSSP